MELGLLLKGILVGFSIAAPVGPIGVLCIRRTLVEGRASGFLSGLGAASADAIYGCIGAFGITTISNALAGQQTLFRLAGGIFLCYLGVKAFIARPAEESEGGGKGTLAYAFASTFLLTLTNPMTILSFAAIFAGFGLGASCENYRSAAILVLGVFAGSSLWWLILSGGVGAVRRKLNPASLIRVNRISGAVITGFGILALAGPAL
jgi:threonine/homoserine/homoserine lactone efflux protein